MSTKITGLTVTVPGPDYRMDARHTLAYVETRAHIAQQLRRSGESVDGRALMWSALLSAVTRSLREELGLDLAAAILIAFAKTMPTAARGDLDADPDPESK